MNKNTVFLYHTESSNDSEQLKNRVYKYQWNGERLVNPILILDLPATPGPDHVGGKLAIGPDNYLYVVIGDVKHEGKLQNFVDGPKPDDTGVILRVNPDDGSPAPDNPFADNNNELSLLNKYYAYGIRNSFGIAFDPITDILWQTENGLSEYDEVNVVNQVLIADGSKLWVPYLKVRLQKMN